MNETSEAPSSEHDQWLERLNAMVPFVRRWSEFIKHPVPPEQGSELDRDSMEGLDVEATAWYLLCVSVEHFNFIFDVIQKTRTMYPTAYMTVARTAFLAGVNALWLLSAEDRNLRRKRALKLVAGGLKEEIVAINEFETSEDLIGLRDAQIEELRRQQTDLQKVAERLGVFEEVQKMRPNQTVIVTETIEALEGGAATREIANGFKHIWRAGSAAAHAQHHFGISRLSENSIFQTADGQNIAILKGRLEDDVGPALAGVFLALRRVFELYERMRSK
ncbi:hypothetical protein [Corynebacterium ammoniagenes]|uniref:PH domain-containing protein n=1 Tax=Corynebacterium ammoniagenes TaxID=1697 RepID=A0AAV5G1N1_CORAM|nr:hypothetical protein [Corynebacterium ammoniagenes]GJN42028.1 hypothetical protein CAT723_05070 [Corynebacterium ammoniagenes]